MQHTLQHATASRLFHLADELSGSCDPEFDAFDSELEREFQELRLQLTHQD